ncbi:MAG: hypothetical protein RIB84_23920 [Sneathiellaceae bacterium]
MTRTIYLVEIVAATDSGGTLATLRYGTEGYNEPSAPGYFDDKLEEPGLWRADIWREGVIGGASDLGVGELVLVNPDGDLDALRAYGFSGRALTLYVGQQGAAWSSFSTVLTGTMEQPEFDLDEIRIRLRDRQAETDVPVQPTKFEGSGGLEGGADREGQPRPLAFGKPMNVPAVLVDSSLWIYQVNDGAVDDVPAVRDRLVGLTQEADYADEATMLSTAPSASSYRVWPAGGYFRLGSRPDGQVTADVVQGASAGDRTAAQIATDLLTGPAGVASGDVSSADVTALDTANAAELGLWIDSETTVRQALDQVLQSVGAFWYVDRAGDFRMRQLAAPAGSPVARLRIDDGATAFTADDYAIEGLERLRLAVGRDDGATGIPAWRVVLNHTRAWTVQREDIDSAATAAAITFASREWRSEVASDASIQTQHLLAPQLEVESLMVSAAAAATEAARLLALFKAARDRYRVTAHLSQDLVDAVDLGDTVTLYSPRYGLSAGRAMTVTGLQYEVQADLVTLDLWG